MIMFLVECSMGLWPHLKHLPSQHGHYDRHYGHYGQARGWEGCDWWGPSLPCQPVTRHTSHCVTRAASLHPGWWRLCPGDQLTHIISLQCNVSCISTAPIPWTLCDHIDYGHGQPGIVEACKKICANTPGVMFTWKVVLQLILQNSSSKLQYLNLIETSYVNFFVKASSKYVSEKHLCQFESLFAMWPHAYCDGIKNMPTSPSMFPSVTN